MRHVVNIRFFTSVGLVLTLVPVIAFSHQRFENALAIKEIRDGDSPNILPNPASVKMLSLGYEQLLADLFWLAFIQYVGDSEGRLHDRYLNAQKYIELISSLDPKLVNVYYFAAFVIGSDQHRPEVATEIIDRGIEANPDNWYLPFIAGINQYLYAHNDIKAAKYYRMAAKFPEAPKWLSRQADILAANIPSIIKEINVWQSIYSSSSDPVVGGRARARLASLWLRVYKSAPSSEIKRRALEQMHIIGVDEYSNL